jgi:hypothetical protein
MTPSQQNEAIAKWFGGGEILTPPDFYGDLNACAEFEQKLSGPEQLSYLGILGRKDVWCNWLSVTATAPQRCEALLRTLGLWEEEQIA